MELSGEFCTACNKGSIPLSDKEIQQFLAKLKGWELRTDGKAILLKKKFKNFARALDFINKVGEIAEAERHHPDIKLGWGYAEITLQTHAIDALHRNDFIVAAKIDELNANDE